MECRSKVTHAQTHTTPGGGRGNATSGVGNGSSSPSITRDVTMATKRKMSLVSEAGVTRG